MKFRVISALALGSLLVGAAFGQVVVRGTAKGSQWFSSTATFSGPAPFAVPAVTGAAYSGEEVTERIQTLFDGTHISQTMPGRRIFRDSQGRTRSERLMGPPGATDAPVFVEITDPVAGFQYTMDTQKKVAHRFALPQPTNQPIMGRAMSTLVPLDGTRAGVVGGTISATPLQRTVSGPSPDGRPQPDFKAESLGTQTIDGVLCEGRRTTTTFPTGFEGNDRPIVTTQETWTSPELKILILSKTSDPRSGDTTFKFLNFSRTEPDASLFQAPPDFQVVDDSGPVTIDLKR